MHVVFYGPEGSGKGTQAKLLAADYHLPLLTFGDLVRGAAKKNTGIIGKEAKRALTEGKYMPDNLAFELWKNTLKTEDAKKGWIMDGFPRSLHQAKFLMDKINEYGYKLDAFIYLSISDQEAIRRLSKRHRKLFSGSKINHDDPQRVLKRLSEYKKSEQEILDYFNRMHLVLKINGERDILSIHKDILNKLNNRISHD